MSSVRRKSGGGVKARLFVYRNCYTGGVAGGDMHTGGVCDWLTSERPESEVFMVYPYGDGQEEVYPETAKVGKINYRDFKRGGSFAVVFIIRAILGTLRVKLPWARGQNLLIASSHFLPDVLPVSLKGKKDKQVRTVYIHHIIQDMPRPRNLNTLLANWQEKVCFALIRRRFDKIIVVNDEVAEALRARGFRKQQILVSSNFVDTHGVRSKPYSQKDITILFCGRMMPQKGVDEFLQISARLQKSDPDFKAVMIGIGPELERLRDKSKRQKLNIEFTDFVSSGQKFDMMSRAKLFVFPSVEEGWGIVVAEALSVGTPVVAYDLPVYKEIFGNTLHTVPLKNADKLSRMVQELLEKYATDPAAYAKEQAHIVDFARRFAREEVARQEYEFLTAQEGVRA